MKYDKDTFEEMIRDWKTDSSPEYDGIEIVDIEFDEEYQRWEAYVYDQETEKNYSLTDDGTGNIVIY